MMWQTQNHGVELTSLHKVQKALLPLARLEWIKHLCKAVFQYSCQPEIRIEERSHQRTVLSGGDISALAWMGKCRSWNCVIAHTWSWYSFCQNSASCGVYS